jgi:glutathione peroxidase-family protein
MTFQRLNAASEGRVLFQRYNLPGHPAYVIVDKQGNVVWRFVGQTTRETLEQAIRRALE